MAANPIVLITGANRGLGLETVKALVQSATAYTILLGGRSIDKANGAVKEVQAEFPQSPSTVTSVQIDIEDDESISRLFDRVAKEYGRLDTLINNAGALFDAQVKSGQMIVREMWNKSWNINATGTWIMTHTFVPLLLKSSDPRLLFIASGTTSLTETENTLLRVNQSAPKGWPKTELWPLSAYRSSKCGMNMLMREWERLLRDDGVKTWSVSPGFLATGLGGDQEFNRKMGALDPTIGGNVVRSVVEGARDPDVGKIIRRDSIQPW